MFENVFTHVFNYLFLYFTNICLLFICFIGNTVHCIYVFVPSTKPWPNVWSKARPKIWWPKIWLSYSCSLLLPLQIVQNTPKCPLKYLQNTQKKQYSDMLSETVFAFLIVNVLGFLTRNRHHEVGFRRQNGEHFSYQPPGPFETLQDLQKPNFLESNLVRTSTNSNDY